MKKFFIALMCGTLLLLGGYTYGIRLVYRSRQQPMWRPKQTRETREDIADPANRSRNLIGLLASFLVLGTVMGACGWLLQPVATRLIDLTGISAVVMGTLFTSFATSLPELVTTLAAVRRGALTLAFSGIIGGNAYDTLFAAFADIAYRPGSIYHVHVPMLQFWLAVSILMMAVLIMGMLVREKRGVANIGFESLLVMLFYVGAVCLLLLQ